MDKQTTKRTTRIGYYIVDIKFVAIMIVLVCALTVDTMINQVADFLEDSLYSSSGKALFMGLSIIFGSSQVFLLRVIRNVNKHSTSQSDVQNVTFLVVCGIQIVLLAIIIMIIYEILFNSMYHSALLVASSLLSYVLNTGVLAFLALKLFTWYSVDKRSRSLLLYSVSFLIIIVTSVSAIIIDSAVLFTKQETISQEMEVIFPTFENSSTSLTLLSRVYHYSSDISFGLIWLATVLLTYDYRHRIGMIRFWIVISLPLIYYISTSVDILGIYVPTTDTESYYFYLYTSLNSTAGGILFGCVFWIIARRIVIAEAKSYLIITGWGFALLFISSQVTLTPSPYPPFGIITLSFYGFSAYLIFFGLYSTALHISRDVKIRLIFRKIAKEQSELFNSMGFAEMDIETQKKVVNFIRNSSDLQELNRIEDLKPSDYEIRIYLDDVLKEIQFKNMSNKN